MEAFEVDVLASDFYLHHDLDPATPPGPFRLAVLLWGCAQFRYIDPPAAPSRELHMFEGGWELELPGPLDSRLMTTGIARGIAGWWARIRGLILTEEELGDLAHAIVLPMAAVREELNERGRGAVDIARLYDLPLEVAMRRVRQFVDHGSGQRPSVPDTTQLVGMI